MRTTFVIPNTQTRVFAAEAGANLVGQTPRMRLHGEPVGEGVVVAAETRDDGLHITLDVPAAVSDAIAVTDGGFSL